MSTTTTTSLSRPNQPHHLQPSSHKQQSLDPSPIPIPRRGAIASMILSTAPPHILLFPLPAAAGALTDFNIPLVRPGQTMEEAMGSVRWDARSMLEQVEELLNSESWAEAQKELRKGSGALRRDIYTIIQGKPGPERAALRKLYSEVFNGVTRLDYAARDRDQDHARFCFEALRASIFDFLSRI